jgi:hypothetical protein
LGAGFFDGEGADEGVGGGVFGDGGVGSMPPATDIGVGAPGYKLLAALGP